MTPQLERVLANLRPYGLKQSGNGWMARCPAHEDDNPSLSICDGDEGKVLLHCHAGCDWRKILKELNMQEANLFPAKIGVALVRSSKPKLSERVFPMADAAVAALEDKYGKRSVVWTYHDAQGKPVGQIVRWNKPDGDKDIRPVARCGDGWRIGAMPDPRPLYGLLQLETAQLVVVTEGEKAADAARFLGFTTTTSAGGANAVKQTDWSPLAGKEVWIFPDNDTKGRKYAETVAAILTKLTPSPMVRIVELPGLNEKDDIVEWIDNHGDAAEPDSMRAEIEDLARAVEPWRPDSAEDLIYQPFPLDALPDTVRGFVTAGAEAIGCDPSYLALPLLTALAASIGNTRRLELKRGWLVPPILWGVIVGESGSAKTPAFKLALRPFRARQKRALDAYVEKMKQYEADLARYKKSMAAWEKDKKDDSEAPGKPEEPQAERFIVEDTTVEALAPILQANPRGLLLSRDELAGWIGSFDRYVSKGKAGSDAQRWLSMFSAELLIVDRKTGNPRTIYVPQAAVCVTGSIQPDILRRALGSEHREAGLAARLLLACPPRKPKRWREADIDPSVEDELIRLVDRLYCLQPTQEDDGKDRPVLVRLTTEARAAWIAYYNSHNQEQADLTGDMAAAWSKLEEYPARLALVLHFIRWAANDATLASVDHVDDVSMNAGIHLARWFKHETRRVYAILDETDVERNQRRLVEWIDRKGGSVTAREVQQGCRWLKESGAAEEVLEDLVKARRGSWQCVPTTAKGGRPARVFTLSVAPT